jgi:thiol-disulfide isomerase/thioredoxin
MGKAERNKKQSARERIAAQQRAANAAERRRRLIAISGITVVVLVVVAIVVLFELHKKSQSGGSSGALPASVQSNLSVPASTLAAVGIGGTSAQALKPVTGPLLTSNGKPEMLYIGAEWCPYCAAERWAMAVALKRFGTFTPLRGIHSSATDVYPNTATLTFFNSKYSSNYLVFTPVENQDVNKNLLVKPTAAQQALWTKYAPPGNSYPFINIGNRFIAGVTYSPQVLHALSWQQIAADLHKPSTPVAQGAVGSANLFTAAICKITNNQPANVCTTAPVSALEGHI